MKLLTAVVVGVLSTFLPPSSAWAGLALEIDKNSFQFNPGLGVYEIDVILRTTTTGATPAALLSVIATFDLSPVINGIEFVGVATPAANALFPGVLPDASAPGSNAWFASVAAGGGPNGVVADGKVVFTVRVRSLAPGENTVAVQFAPDPVPGVPGSFYQLSGSSEILRPFDTLTGASGLTVVGVPEPTALGLLGLSALLIRHTLCRTRSRKRASVLDQGRVEY